MRRGNLKILEDLLAAQTLYVNLRIESLVPFDETFKIEFVRTFFRVFLKAFLFQFDI